MDAQGEAWCFDPQPTSVSSSLPRQPLSAGRFFPVDIGVRALVNTARLCGHIRTVAFGVGSLWLVYLLAADSGFVSVQPKRGLLTWVRSDILSYRFRANRCFRCFCFPFTLGFGLVRAFFRLDCL